MDTEVILVFFLYCFYLCFALCALEFPSRDKYSVLNCSWSQGKEVDPVGGGNTPSRRLPPAMNEEEEDQASVNKLTGNRGNNRVSPP